MHRASPSAHQNRHHVRPAGVNGVAVPTPNLMCSMCPKICSITTLEEHILFTHIRCRCCAVAECCGVLIYKPMFLHYHLLEPALRRDTEHDPLPPTLGQPCQCAGKGFAKLRELMTDSMSYGIVDKHGNTLAFSRGNDQQALKDRVLAKPPHIPPLHGDHGPARVDHGAAGFYQQSGYSPGRYSPAAGYMSRGGSPSGSRAASPSFNGYPGILGYGSRHGNPSGSRAASPSASGYGMDMNPFTGGGLSPSGNMPGSSGGGRLSPFGNAVSQRLYGIGGTSPGRDVPLTTGQRSPTSSTADSEHTNRDRFAVGTRSPGPSSRPEPRRLIKREPVEQDEMPSAGGKQQQSVERNQPATVTMTGHPTTPHRPATFQYQPSMTATREAAPAATAVPPPRMPPPVPPPPYTAVNNSSSAAYRSIYGQQPIQYAQLVLQPGQGRPQYDGYNYVNQALRQNTAPDVSQGQQNDASRVPIQLARMTSTAATAAATQNGTLPTSAKNGTHEARHSRSRSRSRGREKRRGRLSSGSLSSSPPRHSKKSGNREARRSRSRSRGRDKRRRHSSRSSSRSSSHRRSRKSRRDSSRSRRRDSRDRSRRSRTRSRSADRDRSSRGGGDRGGGHDRWGGGDRGGGGDRAGGRNYNGGSGRNGGRRDRSGSRPTSISPLRDGGNGMNGGGGFRGQGGSGGMYSNGGRGFGGGPRGGGNGGGGNDRGGGGWPRGGRGDGGRGRGGRGGRGGMGGGPCLRRSESPEDGAQNTGPAAETNEMPPDLE